MLLLTTKVHDPIPSPCKTVKLYVKEITNDVSFGMNPTSYFH